MARTSDPIDALLAHNLWATRLILEKCRGLSPEQFGRAFPIGPGDRGGLHAILTHIIGAMRRWADRISARPVRPAIENWRSGHVARSAYTPDELLVLLEESHRDLVAVVGEARRLGLERDVFLHKTHSCTAGVAIASAAAHGHYHRAQCMNVLRQLGVPLDDVTIDVIDWQDTMESQR